MEFGDGLVGWALERWGVKVKCRVGACPHACPTLTPHLTHHMMITTGCPAFPVYPCCVKTTRLRAPRIRDAWGLLPPLPLPTAVGTHAYPRSVQMRHANGALRMGVPLIRPTGAGMLTMARCAPTGDLLRSLRVVVPP